MSANHSLIRFSLLKKRQNAQYVFLSANTHDANLVTVKAKLRAKKTGQINLNLGGNEGRLLDHPSKAAQL